MKRWTLALGASLAIVGCGKIAPLTPAPGQSLPIKPKMASATPTAEQLLMRGPQAAPERIDELVRRSEARKTDRFDLPPPDGGAAPTPEVVEQSSSNQAGPVTPQ